MTIQTLLKTVLKRDGALLPLLDNPRHLQDEYTYLELRRKGGT